MEAVTLVVEFEDGTRMAFIGPYNAVLGGDYEIKAVGFSEPHEMPDCKLSDIEEMDYDDSQDEGIEVVFIEEPSATKH